ncbi:MAG: hypothetical protein LBP26_05235 [Clostridiales bacterium]|jgi:tetratricopeptide (TPR) repeat protein|nr:hypothetical protein [Clostridiales bacterium]
MGKVLKFESNAGYYYELAAAASDAGDFVSALDLLFTAKRFLDDPLSDDDAELRLEIAEVYARMGLFDESNKYYFRLAADDYCLDEVFYGLIKNYAVTDRPELAAYYLNLGLESGALDTEDGFEAIDLSAAPPAPRLRLDKGNDGGYILDFAKQLLGGRDSGYARQMIETVPKSSPRYLEAVNYLAIIDMSEGDVDAGIVRCDEILRRDKNNVTALCTKILGLDMQNRRDDVKKLLAELDAFDLSSYADRLKTVMCASQVGDSVLTEKHTDAALAQMPYERDLLVLNALSAANNGNRQKAKDVIIRASVIYPEDGAARCFAREIDRLEGRGEFALSLEIPAAAKAEYVEYIEKRYNQSGDAEEFACAVFTDDLLYEAVTWALYGGVLPLSVKVGVLLAKSEIGYYYMREALLDSDFPVVAKKAVFYELLGNAEAVDEGIQIVVGEKFQRFRPSVPAVTDNAAFLSAYKQVYCTLAFIESGFDRKLNIWYKKVAAALLHGGRKRFKPAALAAVIAYKSGINKIFLQDSYCCEVFDCQIKDFMLYLNIIDKKRANSGGKKTTETAKRSE